MPQGAGTTRPQPHRAWPQCAPHPTALLYLFALYDHDRSGRLDGLELLQLLGAVLAQGGTGQPSPEAVGAGGVAPQGELGERDRLSPCPHPRRWLCWWTVPWRGRTAVGTGCWTPPSCCCLAGKRDPQGSRWWERGLARRGWWGDTWRGPGEEWRHPQWLRRCLQWMRGQAAQSLAQQRGRGCQTAQPTQRGRETLGLELPRVK